MSRTQLTEQIEELEEIQSELMALANRLEVIITERHDENSRAYILAQLQILISDEHMYVSRDKNIGDMIEELRSELEEYDEEEELEEEG